MKKIFTGLAVFSALFIGALEAQAQVGLEIGYANSSQRLKPTEGEMVKTPQSGFYIELDYAVPLVAGLKVAPGIQYMYLAGESKFPFEMQPEIPGNPEGPFAPEKPLPGSSTTYAAGGPGPTPDRRPESVEHYLSIPVDISYTFNIGRTFGLTAFVTPTLNCGLKSDLKMGNTTTDMYKEMADLLGKEDAYSRVDFVMGVGLAADFADHFRIKCSYDFGLLDRASVDNFTLHHNMLKVGLGVMF